MNDSFSYGGYHERLRHSRNPAERRSLIIGLHGLHGDPILLDTELLLEHMHILGSTGSGKTALALLTSATQLIRRNDGAVVIIDCKGDPAIFNTARQEAAPAGRTIKWLTNRPNRATHVFNPFDERVFRRLTLQEILGLILQSLNLHHGDDYGRAWFSTAASILLKHALEQTLDRRGGKGRNARNAPAAQTVQSFQDLDDVTCFITADNTEYQAAKQLNFIVNSLASFPQLNLSPRRNPNHPALQHAIHMPDVIREKQVIYFYLVGAMDLFSVGEISRLAVYSLLSAAIQHREQFNETQRAYCICDEAQIVIAQNIANVLAQARSMGMACILAHQTMSQLNPPGGVDLRELVMNCTAIKQYFTARDPWTQAYLSDMSGRANYFSLGYDQYVSHLNAGHVGYVNGARDQDGFARARVQEYVGPRLTPQEIQDLSRRDNLCFYSVDHAAGLSRHNGFFPVWVDWPMTAAEYRRRQTLPWPEATDATIVVTPDWPDFGPETPALVPPEPPRDPGATARKLQELQRRLADHHP